MLFRNRLVDDETAAWVSSRFQWLISTLGPEAFFTHTQLLLPTARYFTTSLKGDRASAGQLFDEIRAHMGIHHWPVKLVPRATIGRQKDPRSYMRTAVAGSFYDPGHHGPAVITYNPHLATLRNAFIGTMAHELAHYILAPYVTSAPGGEAEHEMLTDLVVIYAGFGVIDLQGAADIGWRGYLSKDGRAFALATFLRVKGIDPVAAEGFLDQKLRRRLARALRQRDARAEELGILKALRPH